MRKLIAYEFLSIDGFMAGREGQEMDFVTKNFLNEIGADIALKYKIVDTFLFGRTTYESPSQYWPNVTTEDEPLADLMNGMNKIVFSSNTDDLKWNNSKLSTKGLVEQVTELKKEEGKDIMIIGSASIVQRLTEERLIDEYNFLLFPVVLGGGKPLFKKLKEEVNRKLMHSKVYKNGVLMTTYSLTQEELIDEIGTFYQDLNGTLSRFSNGLLNTKPFEESWTAGQVAEHIIKSQLYIIKQLLEGPVSTADRLFDREVNTIKEIFRDMKIKTETDENIAPGPPPHDLKTLQKALQTQKKQQIKIIKTNKLGEFSATLNFPGIGNLSRYEWMHMMIEHGQRHRRQIDNIYRTLE